MIIIIVIIIVHFVVGCADRYVGREYICRFPLLSMIAMAMTFRLGRLCWQRGDGG